MYVSIHTDCYGKSLPFLTAMGEYLKSLIPFSCTTDEPEVEKLAGPYYEKVVVVK
jgi:hypothetical protein